MHAKPAVQVVYRAYFPLQVEEEQHNAAAQAREGLLRRNTYQHCEFLCQADAGSMQVGFNSVSMLCISLYVISLRHTRAPSAEQLRPVRAAFGLGLLQLEALKSSHAHGLASCLRNCQAVRIIIWYLTYCAVLPCLLPCFFPYSWCWM